MKCEVSTIFAVDDFDAVVVAHAVNGNQNEKLIISSTVGHVKRYNGIVPFHVLPT